MCLMECFKYAYEANVFYGSVFEDWWNIFTVIDLLFGMLIVPDGMFEIYI